MLNKYEEQNINVFIQPALATSSKKKKRKKVIVFGGIIVLASLGSTNFILRSGWH